MIDLLLEVQELEDVRVELRAKATAHRKLATGFEQEHDDVVKRIQQLLAKIKSEAPCLVDSRLTRSEAEVLQLINQGLSHKEVGSRLNIAERTSKFHLSNVYQKFGITGQAGGYNGQARLLLLKKAAGED